MNLRVLTLLAAALVSCRSQIQHGLDERDANELVSELNARGLDAKKVAEKGKKPTWAIEVADAKSVDALRVLTGLKLPRKARRTTLSVVETVHLIETPQAEKLRALEGLEGDIEESLETMDGVRSASVELVVPTPVRGSVAASKASVLLRVQQEHFERLQQQRTDLRALVAGAVDGLRSEDVVLVLDVTTVTPDARPPPPPAEQPTHLRLVASALGVLLSLVAGLLLFVLIQQRKKPASAPAPNERRAPSVQVQRKAA